MDFDTDILVRLYHHGLEVRHVTIDVEYDATIVSHFRMLSDNVRISIMHTRHFFAMLVNIPSLIKRRHHA